VTAVIPLYNKGRHVLRALRSVLNQKLQPAEIIVVDDGSTDDGPEVVRSMVDTRVRLIGQTNLGPGAARNLGLSQVSTPLVAFLDADDEWMPEFLERSVKALDEGGEAISSVSSAYIEDPGGLDTSTRWSKAGLRMGVYPVDKSMSPALFTTLVAFMWPCGTLFRTSAVRRFGGFFERDKCRYGEDSFLFVKLLLNAPVAVILEPLSRYHREASELSRTWDRPRAVEPLLTHWEELREACPIELRPLFHEFLARRAAKTACAMAYWGKWRIARELMDEHSTASLTRMPLYWTAKLSCGPWTGVAGSLWRSVRSRGSIHKQRETQ
jgi:glycosyltransferase involved in cell wall biosynthesis